MVGVPVKGSCEMFLSGFLQDGFHRWVKPERRERHLGQNAKTLVGAVRRASTTLGLRVGVCGLRSSFRSLLKALGL